MTLQACTTALTGMAVLSKSERSVTVEVPFCWKAHFFQDRYAGLSGPGSYRGGLRGVRGGARGLRGGGLRGGFRGGYGGAAAGRDFSSQDLYADYSGPDQAGPAFGSSGYGAASNGSAYGAYDAEPSQQIMVRNVSVLLL